MAKKESRHHQTLQSSAFVKQLAANDLPTRKSAIKSLKAFISTRKDFALIEYEKLWKGLFYAMWFSDKPRPQQFLTKELGQLFLDIPIEEFEKFMFAYWLIITKEWSGIDHHRLDKFLLMVRRALFYQLKRLDAENYSDEIVESFLTNLRKLPLSGDQRVPHGIPFHLIDIYCDELDRVMFEDFEEDESNEDTQAKKQEIIDSVPLKALFGPFIDLSVDCKYKPLREKVKNDLFEDMRIEEWGLDFKLKQKKQETKEKEEQNEDEDENEDENEEDESEMEENEEEDEDEWTGF